MKKVPAIICIPLALATFACGLTTQIATPTTAPTPTPLVVMATDTSVPPTIAPSPTPTLPAGVIALDFVASLCQAGWMNGAHHLKSCPGLNADNSGGYAMPLDPASQGLPATTPVLLTVPAWNGNAALFLRYPSLTVQTGDRFRATLRCQVTGSACNVQYALEYYDATGKYHSMFGAWNYQTGDPAIVVDLDLGALAGQTVDFVLAVRPNNDTPQTDDSLWIAPQIFRPAQ